jgi:hypothetical protein
MCILINFKIQVFIVILHDDVLLGYLTSLDAGETENAAVECPRIYASSSLPKFLDKISV